MASKAALQWLDGRGWLVLAGRTPGTDAIRARVLSIAAADGGVAYVATQGGGAAIDQMIADMESLGAPSGYLVDVLSEDDQVIHDKLADAGIVVVGADDSAINVRSALLGAAIDGIRVAYENGAVVLAEGPAAMAFGAWVAAPDGLIQTGLEWLQGALIVPGISSVSETPEAQKVMRMKPSALAIGVGLEAALALGPDGEVEAWGDQQVTIALGPEFGA